jgi:hypothetical protein
MAVDDYMESEIAVAVAATAALFSPRVRSTMRRALIYGIAGAMRAGDAIAGAARGVTREAGAEAADAGTRRRTRPAAQRAGTARAGAA